MGPRLDSRGRSRRSAGEQQLQRLQWGRGWTAAEGKRSSPRSPEESRLQWGRGWTAAEGRPLSAPRLRRGIASMGPRLDSRGRKEKRPPGLGGRPLQWGRGWTAAEGLRVQVLNCQGSAMRVASGADRPGRHGRGHSGHVVGKHYTTRGWDLRATPGISGARRRSQLVPRLRTAGNGRSWRVGGGPRALVPRHAGQVFGAGRGMVRAASGWSQCPEACAACRGGKPAHEAWPGRETPRLGEIVPVPQMTLIDCFGKPACWLGTRSADVADDAARMPAGASGEAWSARSDGLPVGVHGESAWGWRGRHGGCRRCWGRGESRGRY